MCYTKIMSRNNSRKSSTRFYRGNDNMWHFERVSTTIGPSKDGSNNIIARVRHVQLGGAAQTEYRRSLIEVRSQ